MAVKFKLLERKTAGGQKPPVSVVKKGVAMSNLEWITTEDRVLVQLDATYQDLTVSAEADVNRSYGTNPLQSAITIAQDIAIKRLRKRLKEQGS